jgi:hypothetical protein
MLATIYYNYGNGKQQQNQPTLNNTGVWTKVCRLECGVGIEECFVEYMSEWNQDSKHKNVKSKVDSVLN